MPPTPASDRDLSVASTLALFCAFLGLALYLRGEIGGIRRLIDRPHVAGEEIAAGAGPDFVQRAAEDDRDVEADDDSADDDADDTDDVEADDVRVADASDHTTGDDAVKPVSTPIEDACIDGTDASCQRWAMDGFYDALAAKGVIRASLWGDSVSAEGHIAAGIRARLDKTYGDGGAGFVFLAKPSRWYQNTAVRQSSKGWVVHSIVHNSDPGGFHGYGGAAFTGTAGDSATFKTAKSGAGSSVSHVEVYYLEDPKGGEADLLVDGEVAATIDSHADDKGSGFTALDVEDGAHEIELRVTKGKLEAFGVTMERTSGVVVDSLGIVSNTAKNMGEIKPAHWQEQIAHRDAHLMMILLGTNESQWVAGPKALKEYRKQWEKVLGSLRAGNPKGTCLVLGTLDAGELVDGENGKKFVGRPNIDGMLDVERAAAKAQGCAFWDARAFMGGDGSSRRWYKKRLMSGDFSHLTKKGGKVLGGGIVEALEAGYATRSKR